VTIRSRIRAALSLRDCPIGRGVPRWAGAALAAAALAAVAIDLGVSPWFIDYDDVWPRIAAGVAVVAALAVAFRRHPDALGLRVVPLPSGRFWLRATIGMAVLFAVLVGVSFAIYASIYGLAWPARIPPPSWDRLPRTCVYAPLVEELIYRWVLVTGLAALGLRWTAVLISGLAFGYLHVRYNVAAANNVAAGFVFAWMYLRSGAISMPVAYHALGNFVVLAANMIGYRLLA
jgi:membrane protease YdiL (CAAX protease family)